MKTALYNEIDPFAAAWLRELIKEGVIADGEVAEKDMWDVLPNELDAYRQVHLCAGIGGWSAALRLAGWPDDRSVWTVSLPCQPFSAAGKGAGLVDERGQLADAFLWLAGVCKPEFIFGEQVEAAIKHNWWDIVASSLETIGYAVGSVSFPASSIGAFHIRQRLYWVADGSLRRLPRTELQCDNQEDERRRRRDAIESCESSFQRLSDSMCAGERRRSGKMGNSENKEIEARNKTSSSIGDRSTDSWMADSDSGRAWRYGKDDPESHGWKDSNDLESGSEACELADSSCSMQQTDKGTRRSSQQPGRSCETGILGDSENKRYSGGKDCNRGWQENEQRGDVDIWNKSIRSSSASILVDSASIGRGKKRSSTGQSIQNVDTTGSIDNFWSDAEWIACRDGKARPIKSGIFPLAYGIPNRVGTLRGAGNAIVPQAAAEFIKAFCSVKNIKLGS